LAEAAGFLQSTVPRLANLQVLHLGAFPVRDLHLQLFAANTPNLVYEISEISSYFICLLFQKFQTAEKKSLLASLVFNFQGARHWVCRKWLVNGGVWSAVEAVKFAINVFSVPLVGKNI
jgi:hypothetical protein